VQANLFGEWSFIREFGHIGRAGRNVSTTLIQPGSEFKLC
jgi:hypothetical protein